MNVDRINSLLSLLREDFLKGVSYVFIFMTWVEERNNNQLQKERWFSLYQKMYHARRLFRISSWIVYGPMIRDLIYMLQEKLTFKAVFALLGHIFTALFLFFDNISMIMMMTGHQSFRTVRRVSYSIFSIGIFWRIIEMAIRLKDSFNEQSQLKKQLQDMTPIQFLERLNDIDQERIQIALEYINLIGDFLPALARTNTPEIIIRTKVNKGTVGFFGMIASLSGIVRKLKQRRRQEQENRSIHYLDHKFL